MTVAGWAGLAGEEDYRIGPVSLSIISVAYLHSSTCQPSIDRGGQGRLDWVFCLQPTLQGRVASIGFEQAWQEDRAARGNRGKRRRGF